MVAAALLRRFGDAFEIDDVEIDAPRADEVQVRMVATGICHTDVKMAGGEIPLPLPLVMGHEGAGVVTTVGAEVRDLSPGDHVVLSYASCGTCPNCAAGHPYYCDDIAGRNLSCARPDGSSCFSQNRTAVHSHFFGQSSFAATANVAARCVVKVATDLPLEMLGPLGCGIQTGAGSVLNVFRVPTGSSVAVFGVGSVGLSAIMAAAVAGASTIIAVDTVASRLDMAIELGATHAVHAGTEASDAAILHLLPRGVDYCLDTTGSARVVAQACAVLATFGTCGLLSSSEEITIQPRGMLRKGSTIRGISEGQSNPPVFIPQLIELYRAGRFPFDKLITFYAFAEINRAIADAHGGATIKPVLLFA